MRKFFQGLGILAAVLFVAGAVGFFFLVRQGNALDSASNAYAQRSVAAIAADWNTEELWRRASPRLLRTAKPEQVSRLFAAAKRTLGPLREFRGSEGQASMMMRNTHTRVSARYVVKARFENGDAPIRVSLVKQDGQWLIEEFLIGKPTLRQKVAGSAS